MLSLIDDDIADLKLILMEAKKAVADTLPTSAQAAYSYALDQLDRARAEAEIAALQAHARDVEDALIRVLGDLSALGIKTGRPRALSSVWRPGNALRNAVAYDVPPSV